MRSLPLMLAFLVSLPGILATGTATLFAQELSATDRPTTEKSATDQVITDRPFDSNPASPQAHWPSFRQNLLQTGVATSSLPEKLELVWEVSLGDQIEASCAISGGKVYAPCLSGHVVCLDLKTGQKEWSYQSIDEIPANSFAPGFKAPVTISRGVVYAGDEDGVMHAIDAATGKRKWIYKTEGEIYSGAVVVDDRLLFGSYDNALHCVKVEDGTAFWKFATDGYVHCTPGIVENSAFIAGCDEHLRRIDLQTGKELSVLPLSTYLIASPAIRGDLLYVGTYANEVVAVNWREMKIAWRYRPSDKEFPFHSSAALGEKVLVIGSRDKQIHGIEIATGKGLWTTPTRARVDSSPAIVGQRVFVGSDDGNLYQLAIESGEVQWKFNLGKSIHAGPVVGEGYLVVGSTSSDGRLCCFGKK